MRIPGLALILCFALQVQADDAAISAQLAGIGFLVGRWDSGNGNVAENNQTSRGSSVVTIEANGAALLRRDHTELFDAAKNSVGSFNQIMLIYPEQGTIRADYSDGQHVIHYISSEVTTGKSVTFLSASQANTPAFKLRYELRSVDTLSVEFSMLAPGQTAFQPIASGTLKRKS